MSETGYELEQPGDQVVGNPVTRERNPTEKGLAFRISFCENNFKTALSTWRRRSNKVSVLMSDCQDADTLREHRGLVENALNELTMKMHQLEVVKDNVIIETEKLEQVESDHLRLMQGISECIREIECQKYEVKSNASKSSVNSKCSSKSVKSSVSRISDAAVRKATLKAELKYIDIEAKFKAELQKIQTLKKMEIAGAEQDALEEVLDYSEAKYDTKSPMSLPQPNKIDYVRHYVESHADLPDEISIHVSESNPTSVFTLSPHDAIAATCDTISDTVTSPAHLFSSEASGNSFPIIPSSSKPVETTIVPPLNPKAQSFVPSSIQPASMQSSWVYNTVQSSTGFAVNPPKTSNETSVSTTPIQINSGTCLGYGPQVSLANTAPSNTSKTEQGLIELAKTLADQVNLSRLPPPEPSVFSGDPLTYPSWKSAFQILIEQRQIPLSERIHYLKRYISGPVRDTIEGFFLLPSDKAYEEAKKTLEKRYGDPFVISNAFRDKLERWPKILPKDGSGLRKFADFLQQCQIAMETIGSLGVLNDDRENRKLLTKLPDWMIARWGRIVSRWKEERSQFPPFKEFVEFLAREAAIACDPVTSLQSLKGIGDNQKNFKMLKGQEMVSHGSRTFLAEVEEKERQVPAGSKPRRMCILCNRPHDLDDCRVFIDKPLPERKSFAKEKGLCFACLQDGHISKKCKHRKRCKICSKFHPTSLHGDTRVRKHGEKNDNNPSLHMVENETDTKTIHAGAVSLSSFDNCRKCSMIVPVYVWHCDHPDRERIVYALLDTQSDTTFILEDTCKTLGVSGSQVKLSLSTMYATNRVVTSSKVQGLMVRGVNDGPSISLPNAYTRSIMPANQKHIPTSDVARMWPHLEPIADQIGPWRNCEIGLLIGYNCPRALLPREVIASNEDNPYGIRTDLGWSVVGMVNADSCEEDNIGLSHRILAQEVASPLRIDEDTLSSSVLFSVKTKVKEIVTSDILRIMERDFSDCGDCETKHSQEDQRFLSVLSEGIHFENGHYEMPLPFKGKNPCLPNNKSYALNRLKSLQRRLVRDETYRLHYSQFMEELLKRGHAEVVQGPEINSERGCVWYIPHHGVYHPQKPDKIRVVFDCSAQFQGQSLNAHLLQGPDLTNKLIGVLCRFRQEPIAITCDVEKMFHQFRVNSNHRDYLRFLWWKDGDYSKEPQDYRMTVHLFGATSSPGCANFGFRKIAEDNQGEMGQEAAEFIRRDFYVDDGLKSVPSVAEAIDLIDKTRSMCAKAGLRLHKFVSNDKDVLCHLKPEDRAKDLQNIDIALDQLPVERTLGILWCIKSDSFQFKVLLNDRPLTRRGILSTVCSMYDPLGFISPVILVGKQILQEMCADNLEWDDPLPERLHARWDRWLSGLKDLVMIDINRCVKPKDFGKVKVAEMHHFSDASSSGYGQCSYLRLINESDQVHCSLLMGKARVAPLKPITIPRLELSAALLSVKVGSSLEQELDFKGSSLSHFYWTDSKVVLGYLSNEARRFHVFVANRVQQIRDRTKQTQWRYVTSNQNPADLVSRGATAKEIHSESKWFKGPDFLWAHTLPELKEEHSEIKPDDPEVKKGQCFSSSTSDPIPFSSILERLEYFSDWHRAKRALAVCIRFIDRLRNRTAKKPAMVDSPESTRVNRLSSYQPVTVDELQRAEKEIIRCVQLKHFSIELNSLKAKEIIGVPSTRKEVSSRHKILNGKSTLHKLDPFLDHDGLLRVGGRIKDAHFPYTIKHPLVLPKKGHMTELVIRHFHVEVQHQGRGITTNAIRSKGFWIIGCTSAVSSLISHCVVCRKIRSFPQDQKMADLPSDRLEPSPPFTYCAVDLFGPWYIKEGRKELKRYGVLFTCLACRAIHVETANSLSTDSFINSLRRFIAIRGPVRQLRSDRGTNFVGAERELKEAFMEFDEGQVRQFLIRRNCDLFEFKMNVPSASHMGGIWERQIRSVRNVMSSLLHHHGTQLDDESLRTMLYEAAAIVNSRPLTVDTIHDPLSSPPLSPNLLLTMKSDVVLPPPGNFQKPDIYSRKRWRRVQYLINQFWLRWRLEYVQNLQVRRKWNVPRRNLSVGDVVLLKEDCQPRNQWRLCRVVDVTKNDDGLVRR